MAKKEVQVKIETWFRLKPKERLEFEVKKILFIVENKGYKEEEVNNKNITAVFLR